MMNRLPILSKTIGISQILPLSFICILYWYICTTSVFVYCISIFLLIVSKTIGIFQILPLPFICILLYWYICKTSVFVYCISIFVPIVLKTMRNFSNMPHFCETAALSPVSPNITDIFVKYSGNVWH